jgi:hypothetical protein
VSTSPLVSHTINQVLQRTLPFLDCCSKWRLCVTESTSLAHSPIICCCFLHTSTHLTTNPTRCLSLSCFFATFLRQSLGMNAAIPVFPLFLDPTAWLAELAVSHPIPALECQITHSRIHPKRGAITRPALSAISKEELSEGLISNGHFPAAKLTRAHSPLGSRSSTCGHKLPSRQCRRNGKKHAFPSRAECTSTKRPNVSFVQS